MLPVAVETALGCTGFVDCRIAEVGIAQVEQEVAGTVAVEVHIVVVGDTAVEAMGVGCWFAALEMVAVVSIAVAALVDCP